MIPNLPTELIKDIIQLSLPPVQYSTYRKRYNMLLAYALVSPIWRSIGQEELMKHLSIKDRKTANLLHRELTRIDSSGEVKMVSIRVYRSAFGSSIKKFSEILSKCKHPKELWISGFSWGVLSNLRKNRLEKLSQLERLHLQDSSLHLSETITSNVSCFQFVEHLTIYKVDNLYHFFENTLTSLNFPSLASFTLMATRSDYLEICPNISPDLAKQIVKLTVYDKRGRVESKLLKNFNKFTSLKSLVLRDAHPLTALDPALASLKRLYILRIHTSVILDSDRLQSWIRNNHHQIEHIHFPQFENYLLDPDEHEAEILRLTQFAERESINLTFHDDKEILTFENQNDDEAWESLLDVLMALEV